MGEKLVLGIDIGGTHMRFGLVDQQYRLSHFAIEDTQRVLSGDEPIGRLIERICAYCNTYLDGGKPDMVSIGFPSTIDRERRIVISTPNIKGMQNLAVVDEMEPALNIPVCINRDVNFLFLYDMQYHKLNKKGTVLGFYIGTGLGNAISIDGKLLLGKNGMAAELGHVPAFGNSMLCGCGNTGCMETLASGIYLEKLGRNYFPNTPIRDMFTDHRNQPEMIKYIDCLSLPIATEVNIFDPDYIIIGGGITQMPDFPTDTLEACIHRHTRKPYPDQNLEILYSPPQQENGVIGAAIYAHKQMESEEI